MLKSGPPGPRHEAWAGAIRLHATCSLWRLRNPPMDTAAFILTLCVILAVGYWYVENEAKASDGAHGLFAVRQAEKPRKVRVARYAAGEDAPRYRPREKSAPAPVIAADDVVPAETPKYRRKERAWDRAAALDGDD